MVGAVGRSIFLGLQFALAATIIWPSHGAHAEGPEVPEEVEIPLVAQVIAGRCVFCHGPITMMGFSRRMVDEGGPEALDTFLVTHHAPDEDARRALVEFFTPAQAVIGSD